MAQFDSPEFYERHWAHTDTSQDPHVVAKAERLLSLVPADVRSVVDVGCGDGYLAHKMAARYDVLAVDRSRVALARLRCKTLEASADDLPLESGSYDLAVSSEVLEHLPDDVLEAAASELARVARRYLLVSVPYRENLRRRFARCPRCRLEFHIDGHLHSMSESTLDSLLPGWRRIATEHVGPPEPATYPELERLRQTAGRRWFVFDAARIVCPRCAEDRFRKLKRRPHHRFIDRAIDGGTWLLNRWHRRSPAPYWLVALYRRDEAACREPGRDVRG
jgi:SAM-dependent methyltransferase